jgi:thioredoxin 1
MGKNVLDINDGNFEQQVLKSDQTFLLDFSATWCGTCKAITPVVDKLADEGVGRYRVGKLDIDDSPGVARQFGIRGVPTLIVFRNGKEAGRHVGASPNVRDALAKLLVD